MVVSVRRRSAAALAVGAAVVAASLVPALAVSEDFEDGHASWDTYGVSDLGIVDGALCATVPPSANPWDAGIILNGVAVEEGRTYGFDFTVSGDPAGAVRAAVGQDGAPYGTVFDETIALTAEPTPVSRVFTAAASYPAESAPDDPRGQIAFQVGGAAAEWTFCLDDVELSGDMELLSHTSFAEGLGPWGFHGIVGEPEFVDGGVCVDLPGGQANPWDAGLSYNGVPIEQDDNYILSFTGSATPGTTIRPLVGENGGAYRTAYETYQALTPELDTYAYPFVASHTFPAEGDVVGQVALQIGSSVAYTFCVTEVSLLSTLAPPPPYEPDTGPAVRVNQVGYATHGPKGATLVTEATAALPWTLERDGAEVASGTTVPRGVDPSAGLNVHTIDFTDVVAEGEGYTLTADGETSYPFAIGADLYDTLRVDSLSFFYPQRSGIEILGEVAGEEYARAAGHVGVAPNNGDDDVACLPEGALTVEGVDLYDGYTCDYTLDVTGGWYDAGDHGKYVVNGGISVGQIMSAYERTRHAASADGAALGDATLRVPEAGNDVPDVLDEARWELEWMLKMVVPEGEQYEGMVHHKVHDDSWTGLPLMPANDAKLRYLHRPSTAATLNLAAVAAQGARLFEEFDAAFAAELLAAAEAAYAAAVATPDLFAPDTNTHPAPGGGPYNDTEVADEFYWAAAELFLTTGDAVYRDAVLANPHHLGGALEEDTFSAGGFFWGDVAAYARIQLATVPSLLPDRAAVRASVVEAARDTLDRQATQPFATPYVPDDGLYEWGSNSAVLNNQALLVAGFDLTGDPAFSHGVLAGMDYLLGRNALNNSYVTDYGTVFSKNQHSRWYAAQIDPGLPHPPPGTVSGGPNSDVPDPVSGPLLAGCAPQFCYIDDIGAWGVNELTINWNSGLAYVASFVADQADALVEQRFSDVPFAGPFHLEISWLVDQGITDGYDDGTFQPGAPVSRQAMAAFLYRAAGSPEFTPPAATPFSDVPTDHPFYREIAWLADEGIAEGYADGTFGPGRTVSRQAMAAYLYRAAGEPAVTVAGTPFPDVPETHPFAAEITWLVESQITAGYDDGTFGPARAVTRQAMAAFLYRAATLPAAG